MRILFIGAEGTVGRAAAAELARRHEVIKASRSSGDLKVDLTKRDTIEAMFAKAGKVDAVVCAAGHVHFGPLPKMTEAEFRKGLDDKLMGQVNLVLAGLPHVNDGGSFTLTSGITNRDPIRGGVSAATVNGALEGFVIGTAIELPRGIRINVVSPGLLEESAKTYDGYFPGHVPVSSARVAQGFVKSVEGAITGQVITID